MLQVKINSNKSLVKEIKDKINENKGHCCCAIEFNEDNVCMCKEFREKIERHEPGFCGCGLYEITNS